MFKWLITILFITVAYSIVIGFIERYLMLKLFVVENNKVSKYDTRASMLVLVCHTMIIVKLFLGMIGACTDSQMIRVGTYIMAVSTIPYGIIGSVACGFKGRYLVIASILSCVSGFGLVLLLL